MKKKLLLILNMMVKEAKFITANKKVFKCLAELLKNKIKIMRILQKK
jgi:hypothetical protein